MRYQTTAARRRPLLQHVPPADRAERPPQPSGNGVRMLALLKQHLQHHALRTNPAVAHCPVMPMYFFHTKTVDGVIEEDTVGAPFDNKDDAIREAHDYIRGVTQDAVGITDETIDHIIEVTDEHGHTVVKLECKVAVQAH